MNFELPLQFSPKGTKLLLGSPTSGSKLLTDPLSISSPSQLSIPMSPTKGSKIKSSSSSLSHSQTQSPNQVVPPTSLQVSPSPTSPLIKKNLLHQSHHHNQNNQKSKNQNYSPILEVVEQESISVENVILNNRNANVHIVVKNTSFVLKIKSLDMQTINFSNCAVKAGLYYANEPLKEVSFIQTPPITYVGSSCNQGEMFALDIKISILSSQHQGNLFYIMLIVTPEGAQQTPQSRSSNSSSNSSNNSSNSGGNNHIMLSHPIRVVSKVDHIKKDGNGGCEKKQTFIDILTDRLNVLENIHVSQSNLLVHMLKQRGLSPSEYSLFSEFDDINPMSFSFSSSPPTSPFLISKPWNGNQQQNNNNSNNKSTTNNNNKKSNSKNTAEHFLESFNKVIKTYKEENKKLELSEFIETLSEDEKNILLDLLDSFTFDDASINHFNNCKNTNNTSGGNNNSNNNTSCTCEKCPYRQQAEQLMLLGSPMINFLSPTLQPSSPSSLLQTNNISINPSEFLENNSNNNLPASTTTTNTTTK
eukprot:gene663-822_t